MDKSRGVMQHETSNVCCNCCGRKISVTGRQKEDYLQVSKVWGYFSEKDLTVHSFNLCENCYDRMVSSFKIPVEEMPSDDLQIYSEEEYKALNEAYAQELKSKGQ